MTGTPHAATARRELRRQLAAYAILLAGVAAIALLHWPGRLDEDSIANIVQLRSGFIGDHRSAVTTWLWQQADQVVGAGPGVVLLAQTAALAAGAYLVLRCVFGRIAAAALTVAILFAPPTFGMVALVGRDMWFVGPFLMSAGIAVTLARRPPRRRAVTALLLLAGFLLGALATSARQNGFTAVAAVYAALAAVGLPLLAGERRRWLAGARRWVAASVLGAAAAVVALGGTIAATAAIRSHHEYPEVYTEIWDLGYLSLKRGEQLIPSLPRDMQPTQTLAEVRDRWLPTSSLWMRWSDGLRRGPAAYDADAAAKLREAWKDAILDHPLTYLRGRLLLWKNQLGIGYTPWKTAIVRSTPNEWGYERAAFPFLSDAAADYARFWSTDHRPLPHSLVHHAWLYLLICCAGVALLLPRFPPATRICGLLAISGLTAQIGLFLLAPSVQWRYQLPTVYAALLVVCVAAALAWRAHRARRATASALPARDAPRRER